MKRQLPYLLFALIYMGLIIGYARNAHAEYPIPDKKSQPHVQVVFVLDTTGSMSGLISAAKTKIWSIANTLATTKPAPRIEMGLVAYRDRGDAYITQCTPLNEDLDAVYQHLMAFKADGGGDTPESVNQALHEAVTQFNWSENDNTYKVIFLVGDCPPHMDYPNDVKYPDTCQLAAKKGIIINAIQCGNHTATTGIWQQIALKAEGQFFQIKQSGNAVLATTPYDKKIAELSRDMEQTRIYYGDTKTRQKAEERKQLSEDVSDKATLPAAAARAEFNASAGGARNFAGQQELVQAVSEKKVRLDKLKDDQLPETLAKMTPEQRKQHIEQLAAKRTALRKQILELSQQRQAFLAKKAEETEKTNGTSLDSAIFKSVKTQGAKVGIEYDQIKR